MTQMRLVLRPLLIFLALGAAPAPEFTAQVVGVSDGDTITVLRDDKTQVKIRLHGIDAPELGQDFGSKAKFALSKLTWKHQVTVQPKGTDRYGRTIADVFLEDGASVTRELVAAGWAWHYVKYAPDDKDLARLEEEARTARRGLWSDPKPVPPWEWRAARRAPVPAESVGRVVANQRSKVYHRPNCPNAAKILEKNRLTFTSVKEAEAAGYRAARDCLAPARPFRVGQSSPSLERSPSWR